MPSMSHLAERLTVPIAYSMPDTPLKEVTVTGIVRKHINRYVVWTDDRHQYTLSAIMPYAAVSPDHDSGKYAVFVGKRVRASRLLDGSTLWNAHLEAV
ncbi:MAG: hypothetical protein HXY34_01760 [Candidatus Thorarchaeota archaeon]|nr:hypothetical protein [Candidatus Thorarchaeota archaeon]